MDQRRRRNREGLKPEEFAAQQAELWRKGLEQWGQSGERIKRLQSSADFAIYTPGSNAGIPISLLKSFSAPDQTVAEDREAMRDRISGAQPRSCHLWALNQSL